MTLVAEIITMSQEMDFQDGSVSHFLILKLPGGAVIKALVTDESARAVVHAKITGAPPPIEPTIENIPEPDARVFNGNGAMPKIVTEEGTNVFEFGGAPTEFAPPAASQPPIQQRKRASRVEKDEWGYPIVRREGGVDADAVSSHQDRDEDGVGQM